MGFCLVALGAEARTATRTLYVISVGHNSVSEALKRDDPRSFTLRYADDDAIQVHALLGSAAKQAFVLSVLDADTQRRFPSAARRALLPSLSELTRVVDLVIAAMKTDRAAGREPELVFFFSGHGVRDASGEASLSLLDGALTRSWLYEHLLARLPARSVHLIIDACHAAAVVRPRDVSASMEPLSEGERQAYLDATTLERFPNVGVVLASSATTQSFEWDAYRSGVFAHELLSGLRGGADVNGDGVVEYSEIAAFMSAANTRVSDARARLEIVVRPPRTDRRAPLLDLKTLQGQFELQGRAEGAWSDGFFVESESGERLLDVFPETKTALALRLPVGERLYLVRPGGEAQLFAQSSQPIRLSSLVPTTPRVRARGSLDAALVQGLFAARFGPAFYQGYVSQRDELVPVSFVDAGEREPTPGAEATPHRRDFRRPLGIALLAGGAAGALAAGVFTGLMLDARSDYEGTDLEQPAHEARERFYRYRTSALVSTGAALALGSAGAVLLLLPKGTEARAALLPEGGWVLRARATF